MPKQFVEDINQTPVTSKSDRVEKAKQTAESVYRKLPWIGLVAGVVFLVGFSYNLGNSNAVKTSEQQVVEPPKQVVVQNKLETASNTITEDVIYVEYLDKVDGSEVKPTLDLKDNVYEVGDYKLSFSQELTKTSYTDVYKLGDTFVYLGSVENSTLLEDAYLEEVTAQVSLPPEVLPSVREFANAAANYSLESLDAYIWQKQVDFEIGRAHV